MKDIAENMPPAHSWSVDDIGSRDHSPDYWRGWNAYRDQAIDVLKLAECPTFDLDEVCEFIFEIRSAICLIDQDPTFVRSKIETQCDRLWGRMEKEKWTGIDRWTVQTSLVVQTIFDEISNQPHIHKWIRVPHTDQLERCEGCGEESGK